MSNNLNDLLEISSSKQSRQASDEPITAPRQNLPSQKSDESLNKNQTIECGNCGAEIPVTSLYCPKCKIQLYGKNVEESLKNKDYSESSGIAPEDSEITYSPSRISNYATLKTIAQILKGFAWITGIGGGMLIVASFGYSDGMNGPEAQFYLFLALGVAAFFIAIQSSLFSESINVILDIEANSRQTAKTLERILKSQ